MKTLLERNTLVEMVRAQFPGLSRGGAGQFITFLENTGHIRVKDEPCITEPIF